MKDKGRLKKWYRFLKRTSFYLLLVFLTSLLLGLISGIDWMFEMALTSLAASFGTISASDILWDRMKPKELKESKKLKGS